MSFVLCDNRMYFIVLLLVIMGKHVCFKYGRARPARTQKDYASAVRCSALGSVPFLINDH